MAKSRACKICNTIKKKKKCTKCDSKEHTESFKGRIVVINPEKSEIAQRLKLKDKGNLAIKTR